jgi:hypothetical protein
MEGRQKSENAMNTGDYESENSDAPDCPWTTPVKSEGPQVVARSVTKAKPLSPLELTSELPMTGRADAIRRAVEMELGQHTVSELEPVDEAEVVS